MKKVLSGLIFIIGAINISAAELKEFSKDTQLVDIKVENSNVKLKTVKELKFKEYQTEKYLIRRGRDDMYCTIKLDLRDIELNNSDLFSIEQHQENDELPEVNANKSFVHGMGSTKIGKYISIKTGLDFSESSPVIKRIACVKKVKVDFLHAYVHSYEYHKVDESMTYGEFKNLFPEFVLFTDGDSNPSMTVSETSELRQAPRVKVKL